MYIESPLCWGDVRWQCLLSHVVPSAEVCGGCLQGRATFPAARGMCAYRRHVALLYYVGHISAGSVRCLGAQAASQLSFVTEVLALEEGSIVSTVAWPKRHIVILAFESSCLCGVTATFVPLSFWSKNLNRRFPGYSISAYLSRLPTCREMHVLQRWREAQMIRYVELNACQASTCMLT